MAYPASRTASQKGKATTKWLQSMAALEGGAHTGIPFRTMKS
jgi:hypothetical protein